ncbi:uncharacterized protein [Lepisosteus oculatus]|uniref:uncharacterized protein isoform X2 n=1 Tax=Lepisosteus oculatus TaxID=7918 RepID=UPI00073FD40C|nr:PREDICTED: uncharacterized protein LOC107079920 isoform X2 [Lepisosteus oculatus]
MSAMSFPMRSHSQRFYQPVPMTAQGTRFQFQPYVAPSGNSGLTQLGLQCDPYGQVLNMPINQPGINANGYYYGYYGTQPWMYFAQQPAAQQTNAWPYKPMSACQLPQHYAQPTVYYQANTVQQAPAPILSFPNHHQHGLPSSYPRANKIPGNQQILQDIYGRNIAYQSSANTLQEPITLTYVGTVNLPASALSTPHIKQKAQPLLEGSTTSAGKALTEPIPSNGIMPEVASFHSPVIPSVRNESKEQVKSSKSGAPPKSEAQDIKSLMSTEKGREEAGGGEGFAAPQKNATLLALTDDAKKFNQALDRKHLKRKSEHITIKEALALVDVHIQEELEKKRKASATADSEPPLCKKPKHPELLLPDDLLEKLFSIPGVLELAVEMGHLQDVNSYDFIDPPSSAGFGSVNGSQKKRSGLEVDKNY